MNKNCLVLNYNTISFKTEINFQNLMDTINFYTEITECLTEIIIDFKNIRNSNSCLLVFMVSCIRNSRKRKQYIKFINMSETLLELSKLYNIDTIIPI